jgi:integrase
VNEAVGLTGIPFHDLRHTGNILTSEAGATLRELMDRMGHSSTRAALIYQGRSGLMSADCCWWRSLASPAGHIFSRDLHVTVCG